MNQKTIFIFLAVLVFFSFGLWGSDHSLSFNSEGQYVDCGNSTYYDLTNNLTIEAWIYPTNFKDGWWKNTIASKVSWSPTNTYGWSFRYGSASGKLEFNMSGGGNIWLDCTADNALTLNTWQHVAATYNGNVVKLYVNGVEVASLNNTSSIPASSKKLLIGAIDQTGDWRNMTGNIDQVRIWDIARSQSEIADNRFNSVTADNLLADFQFNTGSGTTAINSANNNYNGTLVNASWSDNLPYYTINIDTGNISGVNISTETEDYGNDPGEISLENGFSGTVSAEKDNYIWTLASGSDSNIISNLTSSKNISFVGTFTLEDVDNPGFIYSGQADVQVSATSGSIESLEVPLPANTTDSDIVMVFNASTTSDLEIAVPAGTWYVIAYYNDSEDGGLTWHQGNPYPAIGPTDVVFTNVSFGSKGNVPIIISPEDTTLPVGFASFTGSCLGENIVSLDWVTHSESNLSGFSVLRAQDNDLNLAKQVGSMIFATNTAMHHKYSFTDETINENGQYYYWLKIVELGGNDYFHGPITVFLDNNFEDPIIDIPVQTQLHNAYPNPFNPSTTISYTLKKPANVEIEIFNIAGRKIWNKSISHNQSGNYNVVWKGLNSRGKEVVSGIYYYRFTSGKYTETRKMVLMK